MSNVSELTVEFKEVCLKADTKAIESYRLEGFVPGREFSFFDFWLTPKGELKSASKSFLDLDEPDRTELIHLGTMLIHKL